MNGRTEQNMYPVQPFFPSSRFLLEYSVIWRKLDSLERIKMLAALGEQIVPTAFHSQSTHFPSLEVISLTESSDTYSGS